MSQGGTVRGALLDLCHHRSIGLLQEFIESVLEYIQFKSEK